MSEPNSKLVEVYRAENIPEAHMIRISLEEAGIDVYIDGELLQGGMGELALGWSTAPRIMVSDAQLTRAREILAMVDVRKKVEAHWDVSGDHVHCLACGNAMTESEVKCANCGWSYEGDSSLLPRSPL